MTDHIETLLPPAIRTRFPGVRVVTETPADLTDACPLIAVIGIGGDGDAYQFDTPKVDLEVYDVSRDGLTARENSRALAQQVHDWLLRELPGTSLGSAFVLSVNEFMSPVRTPYDNTDVRKFVCSVGLRLHDRSSS